MRSDIKHLERTRSGRHLIRVRSTLWVGRAFLIFVTALYAGGEFFDPDLQSSDRLLYGAFVVLAIAAWVAVGERLSVELRDDGIVARGGLRLRDRRIPWNAIDRFKIVDARTRWQSVAAVLRDGRRVRLPATEGPNPQIFSRHRATQECLAILEYELARARGTSSPDDYAALARVPVPAPPGPSRRAAPTTQRLMLAVIGPAVLTTLGSLIGHGSDSPVTGWSGTIAILSIPAWIFLFDHRQRRVRTWGGLAVLAFAGATGGLALQTTI